MATRYKSVERDQLLLMPYELREWIPQNDIVHFIIEAAELVPLESFQSNQAGKATKEI